MAQLRSDYLSDIENSHNKTLRQDFMDYLEANLHPEELPQVYVTLNTIEEYCLSTSILRVNFFDLCDINEVINASALLTNDFYYWSRHDVVMHQVKSLINRFCCFLKLHCSESNIVSSNTATTLFEKNPLFSISKEDILTIHFIIEDRLRTSGYITDAELLVEIVKKCPTLITKNNPLPTSTIWEQLQNNIVSKKFQFRGATIMKNDFHAATSSLFTDFCESRGKVTKSELKELSRLTSKSNYFGAVAASTIRISEDEFVHYELLDFDIEATDSVLETLCVSEYTPIKDIVDFSIFPEISIPWNGCILEGYLFHYSQNFRLVHENFFKPGHGDIVRAEIPIKDSQSLAADEKEGGENTCQN